MRRKYYRENNMAESMENDQDVEYLDMEADSDSGAMEIEAEDTPGADEIERLMMETDISDFPKILIVTNVDVSVFENDNSKSEFERIFKVYDENATFQYFKSFRRVRVNYSSPLFSASARIDLHESVVCGQTVKCFFFQPILLQKEGDDPHLKLPPPHKQFLISPPASPPVDWEQSLEARPKINYDLLSAVAELAPEYFVDTYTSTGRIIQLLAHNFDVKLMKYILQAKISLELLSTSVRILRATDRRVILYRQNVPREIREVRAWYDVQRCIIETVCSHEK